MGGDGDKQLTHFICCTCTPATLLFFLLSRFKIGLPPKSAISISHSRVFLQGFMFEFTGSICLLSIKQATLHHLPKFSIETLFSSFWNGEGSILVNPHRISLNKMQQ